jgi:hypothetical protein
LAGRQVTPFPLGLLAGRLGESKGNAEETPWAAKKHFAAAEHGDCANPHAIGSLPRAAAQAVTHSGLPASISLARIQNRRLAQTGLSHGEWGAA